VCQLNIRLALLVQVCGPTNTELTCLALLVQVYGPKPPAAGKRAQQLPASSAAMLREFVASASISKRICLGRFIFGHIFTSLPGVH
jgi:hypothetical protein